MARSNDDDDPAIYAQWPRTGCVRLRPPQNDDEPLSESHPLSSLIRSAFNNTDVRRIEVLSWPAEPHQEWVLHPIASSAPSQTDEDEELSDPEQAQLGDSSTSTSATHKEPSAAKGALENACEEHLTEPYGYGYDRCAVDLSPLEGTLRPTCRLAVRESPDLMPLSQRNPHGVVQLISDLNDSDVPYLFQTIVSRGSDADFELSQRLAIYPPNYGIATEHDFAKYLDDTTRIDLSTYYDAQSNRIRSNFDLDGTRYFEIDKSGGAWKAVSRHKHDVEIIRAARRVLAGRKECHDLYAGYHDTDKELESLYQYANYYTKIPIDSRTLQAFVALVADQVTYSPWKSVSYVDPPKLITTPIQLPAGADTSTEEPADQPDNIIHYDDERPPTLATRGSDEHQYNEDFVASYYRDRGWTVEQLDIDVSASVPDIRIQKDGQTYFVEVEQHNLSQPANILTNAARAAHHDMDVIFVGEDKSTAQSIVKLLREPVRDTDVSDGARLYTQSSALTLDNGDKPLLPPSLGESRWYLRYSDAEPDSETDEARSPSQMDPELRLETPDGDVIVSGSVEEGVASWTGFPEVVAQTATVPDDRTPIYLPFVPTQLAYLQRSSLQYYNGDQLEQLEADDYSTTWNQSDAAGKRERYENAYKKFVDRYTVPIQHSEIEKTEVINLMNEAIYKPQTSRKAPGMRESGRALWKYAEQKSREDNTLDLVKNRTWRWPRHVTSPDLPFVGEPSTVLKTDHTESI
jgi:hypothetical protein